MGFPPPSTHHPLNIANRRKNKRNTKRQKKHKGRVHSRGADPARPPPRYPRCFRPPPPQEATTQSHPGRPRLRLNTLQGGSGLASGLPWCPPRDSNREVSLECPGRGGGPRELSGSPTRSPSQPSATAFGSLATSTFPPRLSTSHGRTLIHAHRSVASSSVSGRPGTYRETTSRLPPPLSSQTFFLSTCSYTSSPDGAGTAQARSLTHGVGKESRLSTLCFTAPHISTLGPFSETLDFYLVWHDAAVAEMLAKFARRTILPILRDSPPRRAAAPIAGTTLFC